LPVACLLQAGLKPTGVAGREARGNDKKQRPKEIKTHFFIF